MTLLTWLAVASISLARLASAAQAEEWAARSIYQVMTDRYALPNGSTTATCNLNNYCGGTWGAIMKNLDYIQNMGFTAVQISPVDKNIPDETEAGEAYHGYWPVDKYSLNENFGTAADLKDLADELHRRDMLLLVDVVVNDMAYTIPDNGTLQPGATTDFSHLIPFNQPQYYNPLCNITDWSNATNYQNCWFSTQYVALPDLDTLNQDVMSLYNSWIKGLVANYSIDGIRIDAAKSVDPDFLPGFIEAAGVWAFSEVDSGTADDVCVWSNLTGLENYSVYYAMIKAFTLGDMDYLSAMLTNVSQQCENAPSLQNFAENHDQARFASLNPDLALAKNAITFVMMADGVPKIYSGQEQHVSGSGTPDNRSPTWLTGFNPEGPLVNITTTLNLLRNHAINLDTRWLTQRSVELYLDNSTMAMAKGPPNAQTLTIYSNQGTQGGPYDVYIPEAFPPFADVIEVLTCTTTTTNSIGHLTVPMNAGVPHVYFPAYNLQGSGLCGTELVRGAINNYTAPVPLVPKSGSERVDVRWYAMTAVLTLATSVLFL